MSAVSARHLGWVCLLSLLLLRAPYAVAADAGGAERIGPGDVLRIEVGNRADLSGTYTVPLAGSITMPVVGVVKAAGRTTGELADDLSRRFSLVDREIPRVGVLILQSASRKILVLGAVMLPGAYDFTQTPTAWEAITRAGGATEDAALSAVEVIPGDATPGRSIETVDIASAIQSGKLEQMPKLKPGDTVRVPRAQGSIAGKASLVYVFGAVGTQGAHPLDQAPDLLTAIILSGGPAPDADLSAVEIVRRNGSQVQHLSVDLRDYLGRGEKQGNLPLQEGDTVYVRRATPRGGSIFSALQMISPLMALLSSAVSVIALTRH